MAQSAFAAGGGNAKMAQLKKLQTNRNLSPAALRRLVEQIGRRNLKQNEPQRPRQGQGSRKPKPKPQTTSSTPAKRGMSNIPKSEGTGGAAEKTLGYGAGKPKGNNGSSGGSSGSSRRPAPKPATLSAAEKKKRADAAHMKAELLKIKKAEEASDRQKANKAARDKAYRASLEQAKKNRARGNTRPRGPRG